MKYTSLKARGHLYGYGLKDMTIGSLVRDKARINGERVFLHYMEDNSKYTYGDLERISARVAGGLAASGMRQGAHVGLLMDNCPELLFLYLGIARAGGVAVPINPSARGKLLTYFIEHSDSEIIVAADEYLPRVSEALQSCPKVSQVYGVGNGSADVLFSGKVRLGSWETLMKASPIVQEPPVKFSDLAMLSYTSGTTGPSKGNMVPHAAVVQYGMTTAESHGYQDTDVIYVPLPINHAAGYLCNIWGAYIANAQVALTKRFSVSRYWGEIRDSGATITNLMGSMVNMLWSKGPTAEDRQHRLRLCLCTPVPKFALEWEERYNTRIVSSYGQSDYVSSAVYSLLDPAAKLGSAGRPRAGIEMRIVDEDDQDVAPGEVGELILRTNNPWSAAQGYYKMPDATLEANRNLWWHTGDLARVDADGYLFFADRKKDALRRRGENISAYEVESIVSEHPAVQEVAVYAVSSEMSEDEVAMSVVLKAGTEVSELELIEFCVKNMAHYMVPRFVHVTDDLPRTQNQKVQKATLRENATKSRDMLWDREKSGVAVTR